MSIIQLKSQTDLSGFHIFFEGSTMNERKGIYGISHLMEHLVCKSFEKYIEDFENDGIVWNAETHDSYVRFYFTGLEKYINKYIDRICNEIFTFNITEEQLEMEKKIVVEEYKDSFNRQIDAHILNLSRKKMNSYGAIGLLEDIENITMKDCMDFFEVQYSKPTKIIHVTKNDHRGLFQKIEFANKIFTNKLDGNYTGDFFYEKSNLYDQKSSVINFQMVDQNQAHIMFITRMLGAGLKSPLYQEVREKKGLVYYIGCDVSKMTNNDGMLAIYTETSDDNVNEVQDTIFDVIGNPEKFMTRERFNIVKQSYEIRAMKDDINRFVSIDDYLLADQWKVSSIINDITYDQIMDVYGNYLTTDKFYKSVDKTEFIGL